MKNFIQEGHALDLVAPSGGVTSGNGVLIGSIFAIASTDAAEGETFSGHTRGVYELTAEGAVSNQDGAVGDLAYWDNTEKRVTRTKTGNKCVGVLTEAKASADSVATVLLVPSLHGEVATLTENGGAIGGTNDGDMPTVTTSVDLSAWNGSTNPTSAQATAINAAVANHGAALRELAAKLNAVIGA
jgi:predicted RecA/RadA family phage recombinase